MTSRRTTRLSLWAALTFGVMAFAGDLPSAAASCGDYVHILPPGQTTPDADPAAPTKKPCSGPGCQQAPPAPVPTPPPAPTTVSVQDAILSAVLAPTPGIGEWLRYEPVLSPCRMAAAIFHPPRA
ncbi:MAG TPA: hypothetical protein VFG68_07820 [Fimbriiglobus sp.]|nr:hypothetical protein [Fimbriiglobus sp.]